MTTATLGLAVQSGSAVTAAADLDKLTQSAAKAERGATSVGRASRDMAGALQPITALLVSIDRNTATLAAGLGKVSTATMQVQRAAVSVSASLNTEATGFRSATEAMRQNTIAANENRAALVARNSVSQYGGANNFNTANVAAQFQDIGVTAAMGMSPLQIALQQGTQLSAVLGGQGLTGVVRTLGGAFASILSPVSLLTIAAVALGATALQSLGGMFQGAETATDALERHNETLDKTLAGYDDVRDAADEALAAALKLPQASAESELGAQRGQSATAAIAAMERLLQLRQDFEAYAGFAESGALLIPADVTASLVAANDVIKDITADSALSRQELDQMHTALTELGNNTADQNIRDIVNEALALVDAARQAFAQVDSLDTALRNIPRDIQIRLQVSQEFNSSMGDLGDLYIDPRDRFEVAREQAKNLADQATATAATYGDLVGVGEEYQRVLASIDAAEAEASEKAGRAGAKAAAKPFNQWESATDNFQQRIEQANLELELLGQSTYEVERQKAAFDLLNQAKEAGVPITDEVTSQISRMSEQYATATVELERQVEAQQRSSAILSTLTTGFSDLFKGIIKGTKSAGDAVGDLLGKLGDLLIDQAFSMLFGGMFGGGGLGGGMGKGGLLGGMIIPGILHSGGTAGVDGYGHGRAFSASTWLGAQRYHSGGIAGLGPDEVPAILQRGERVIPANQNTVAQNSRMDVNIRVDVSGAKGDAQITALARQAAMEGVGAAIKANNKQLPSLIQDINMRQG